MLVTADMGLWKKSLLSIFFPAYFFLSEKGGLLCENTEWRIGSSLFGAESRAGKKLWVLAVILSSFCRAFLRSTKARQKLNFIFPKWNSFWCTCLNKTWMKYLIKYLIPNTQIKQRPTNYDETQFIKCPKVGKSRSFYRPIN